MKKTDRSQEKVLIGKAGSPVGIKGEFRITLYSQDSGNLKEGKVLLLEHAEKTGRQAKQGPQAGGAQSARQGERGQQSQRTQQTQSARQRERGQQSQRALQTQPIRQGTRGQQTQPARQSGVPGTLRCAVERVRYQKDRPVIKLEGIDDRNAAEEIRGMEISIMACDLEELPEGEHYVRDLIGCRVVNIAQGAAGEGACAAVGTDRKEGCAAVSGECEGGAEIGVLADVIQNTAQSILDVRTPDGKSVLIPAVDAFLRSIDEEAGIIEVELIPGFLD